MATSEATPKTIAQVEPQSPPEVPGNKEKEKTMTDSNFERLEQLIVNQIEKLENTINKLDEKFDKINDRVGNLETEVAKGFAKVEGEIKRIDEKIDGRDKRLENAEKISYTTLTALLLAVVGGIVKFIFGN